MGELAVLAYAFNAVVNTASKIQELGEGYYKASAAWDDFKLKVGNLRREGGDLFEALRNHGISDPALIDTLNRAMSVLEKEEEKLLRRELGSKWIRLWFKVHLLVLAQLHRKCIGVQMIHRSDEEAGQRLQRGGDAFKDSLDYLKRGGDAYKDILDYLKLRDDIKAATKKKSLNRCPSLLFRNDDRCVPLEETEGKIYSALDDFTLVLLHGGPGRGKSTLAQHVALHYQKSTMLFDQVMFLECGLEVKTSVKQFELLQLLGVYINEENQQSTSDSTMVHQLRGALKYRKVLIIFDDVWEVGFLQQMIDLCGDKVKCLVTMQQENLCQSLNCPSLQKVPKYSDGPFR